MAITFGGAGPSVAGTTSVAVAYPSNMAAAAGQLLFMVVATRVGTSFPTTPTGWLLLEEGRSLTGTAGAGVGPVRTFLFVRTKLITGTETGTVTVTQGSANATVAFMFKAISSTGEFYVEAFSAVDTSDGTSFNLSFTPNVDLGTSWIRPGDMLFANLVWPKQSATQSAVSVSAPGLTLTGQTAYSDANTTTGNDLRTRGISLDVDSGTQTDPTVTLSSTLSATSYGAGTLLRVSDSPMEPLHEDMPYIVARGATWSSGTAVRALPPIGIQDGDLILATSIIGNNASTAAANAISKGWAVLDDAPTNTRRGSTFARIYDSADPDSTYDITIATSSQGSATSIIAVRNHGVEELSDLIVGVGTSRGSSSSITTSLGITVPDRTLVIAVSGEATNAVGDWSQTTGDFTLAAISRDLGVVNSAIEYSILLEKSMEVGGATGNVLIDWAPAGSLNGRGLQVGIPAIPIPALVIPTYRGSSPIESIYKGVTSLLTLYKGTFGGGGTPGLAAPTLVGMTGAERSGAVITLDTLSPDSTMHVAFIGIAGNAFRTIDTPAGWNFIAAGSNPADPRWNQYALYLSSTPFPDENFVLSGAIESGIAGVFSFAENVEIGPAASNPSAATGNQTINSPGVNLTKNSILLRMLGYNHIGTSDATFPGEAEFTFGDVDAVDATERYSLFGYPLTKAPGPIGEVQWGLSGGSPYIPVAHTIAVHRT